MDTSELHKTRFALPPKHKMKLWTVMSDRLDRECDVVNDSLGSLDDTPDVTV